MEPEEGTRPLPRHRFVELPVFGTASGRTGGAVRADQIAELRTIAGIAPDDTAPRRSEPEQGPEQGPGPGSDLELESEPAPRHDAERAAPKSSRIPALDGLRALAVAAVLLYHAGFSHARGGFLGVDVFFVLSGYLITGLLAREYLATGAVALGRFYQRRARRLLPALFVVLAGVCAYVVLCLPSEAAGFRSDATASLFYVTNWWFVAKGQSYFGGTGRPSLLLHLWSLAVEEQFYVVWPAFLLVALGRSPQGERMERIERIRALWRAVGWATLLSACSIGLCVMLYSPWRDPSRVYYGTDTRAFELLIGVLAALVQIAREKPRQAAAAAAAAEDRSTALSWRRIATESASFLTLAGIVWAFAAVPASSPALYPFGLAAVSVASAVLIRTLVAGTAVSNLLSRRMFVWLGERSYALYLWHWPIFDVTRPGADVAWPAQTVFLVRVVLSLLFADLTYRFIETPVRHGALGRAVARAREAFGRRELGVPLATAGSALAVLAAAAMLADTLVTTAAAHPADARAVAVDNRPDAALDGPRGAAPQPEPHAATTGAVGNAIPNYPTAMPPRPAHPPRVALIGDSQGMTLYLNRPPDTAEYLRLFDDTTEGCDFLGGRISSGAGDRRDLDAECGGTVAKWASRISRDRAAAALLMVGAWDLFDEQVNGTALPFGSAGWDAYFTGRLAQTVSTLKATGLPQLDLALLPCYRPVHTSGSGGGLWPERGDDSRVAHVNALLAAYVHDPAHHVRAVYPPAQFCQDPAIAASRSYRWDGVHYYKPGARLYLRNTIPQLLEAKTS
ncbi:acyltransferase [Catenulispora sp. NF23]|uniref:acyltransferase family protein n=1 Tax=Catenulispora pinistramenti TaxID=2705254 RepID=UPI001BAA89D2|nr:acyltransferase family protein [Catenulispora pinistramenti]MBS2537703.1 acyltransferase [Catenulispora pinistramenti]